MNRFYSDVVDNKEDNAEMEVEATTSTNPNMTNAAKIQHRMANGP